MARGSSLLAFIITRLLLAVPMLLFLLTFVFVILRILPGDPVLALWGGRNPPPEVIEAARRQLGLDQPAFPIGPTGMYTVDSLLARDPAKFLKALSHLILPSLTLGIVLSGFFTKTVRANMLRTVGADYVEAARARGVRERRVVYRHAFKNALVPVVTVLGLQFAVLFGGAILTETTFGWDGMGKLLYDSI